MCLPMQHRNLILYKLLFPLPTDRAHSNIISQFFMSQQQVAVHLSYLTCFSATSLSLLRYVVTLAECSLCHLSYTNLYVYIVAHAAWTLSPAVARNILMSIILVHDYSYESTQNSCLC